MATANRTARKSKNSTITPDPEAALQDLMRSILNRRQGKPATFAQMCDAVDRGPSRVRGALTALRASGLSVRLAGMRSFAGR
ncbi:MAG: hypothetical protein ACLPPV_03665 [Candidatus Korobacteraceae bacterium]|jgi:hypothetical protein